MEEKQKQRCDELHKLGLKFNGEDYQDKKIGVAVHHTDILCCDDEEWKKIIDTVVLTRKLHSDVKLSDKEKEILFKVADFYIEHRDLDFDEYSDIADLRDRMNPKYWKDEDLVT